MTLLEVIAMAAKEQLSEPSFLLSSYKPQFKWDQFDFCCKFPEDLGDEAEVIVTLINEDGSRETIKLFIDYQEAT